MKKILVFLSFISFVSVFAQTSSIKITSPHTKVTFEPTSILYTGMDNTLRIESSDPKVQQLSLNIDSGEVRPRGKDFIVRVKSPGEVMLKIYDNTDAKNPKLIESRKMRVISQSPISVTLAGKNGGNIRKEELMKAEKFEVECPQCKDEKPFMMECKLSITGQSVEYKEFTIRDGILSDDIKAAFKNLTTGSKIIVEFIKVSLAENDPSTRLLSPLTFVVTD